jgi:hypothetical protein
MIFRYAYDSKDDNSKWESYPQKRISGDRLLDRFEWDNFVIYHTDEDIHFFREPFADIFDDKFYTEYALVSVKN